MIKTNRRKTPQRTQGPPLPEIDSPLHFFTKLIPVFISLVVLAILIYSNTLSVPFTFDDVPNIVANPRIQNLRNFLDFSGSRYVGYLSFALNYHFGGLNLFGYHLINLAIHIANGIFVYLFVRLLFKTPRMVSSGPRIGKHASWLAMATSLLFIVHPIQTQAVTYIVQRFASLAAFFYLLTVVCYLKWRLALEQKAACLWYTGALFFVAFAMKTKEISFTIPMMLLLIEVVFFPPFQRRRWRTLIPFLLTLFIIPLSRPDVVGQAEAGFARQTTEIGRADYLFTQFRVIVTYLRLLILPIHQNLDYDYPVYHSFFEPSVFISFLVLISLLGLAIYLFRLGSATPTQRLISFGMAWFFLTLSIESSIIPIQDVIFEHRLYLPSIGFFFCLNVCALKGFELFKHWLQKKETFPPVGTASIAGAYLVFIILPFSVSAYQRNAVWGDSVRLWEDVVRKSPQKWGGHNNLAVVLENQGRLEEAISHYEKAIQLNPNNEGVHYNVGAILEKRGQLQEAVQHYSEALRIKPDYEQAHNNLGIVLSKEGKWDEARIHLMEALQLQPDDEKAHKNLAAVLLKQGKVEDAIAHYRRAIQIKPNEAEIYVSLAQILEEAGKRNDAALDYSQALRIEPSNAAIHNNFGILLEKEGKLEEAIFHFSEAIRLMPDLQNAHKNLGVALVTRGDIEQGAAHFIDAVRIEPNDDTAHFNLGIALARQRNFKEALTHFIEVVRIKPDDEQAHYNLGLTYYQLGNLDNAVREFKTTLQINPHASDARRSLEILNRSRIK